MLTSSSSSSVKFNLHCYMLYLARFGNIFFSFFLNLISDDKLDQQTASLQVAEDLTETEDTFS